MRRKEELDTQPVNLAQGGSWVGEPPTPGFLLSQLDLQEGFEDPKGWGAGVLHSPCLSQQPTLGSVGAEQG